MNKQELQEQLKELEEKTADIRKQLEGPEKVELWGPSCNEYFYFITGDGLTIRTSNPNTIQGEGNLKRGNCFRTKEDAEYYAQKRAARNRLEMLAHEVEGGSYEFQLKRENWVIQKGRGMPISAESWVDFNFGIQYFSSKENAQRVLDSLSYEDKKILWGGDL